MGVKFKSNEDFFDTWSSKMAYVLGYIYAYGHIIDSPYMRGKYLNITSTDKDSIDRIKCWLKSEHNIKIINSGFVGRKLCYVLRIGSHRICNKLYSFGLHPKKSLDINFPKIPKKFLWHFVRGYFDGDGCVYLEKRKGKKIELKLSRIRTIFTSGSKNFLVGMNEEISKNGILNGKIYKSKRSLQLVYGTVDSVQLFTLMYKDTTPNSFFMRKFNVYREYFKLRPIRIDKSIRKILAIK